MNMGFIKNIYVITLVISLIIVDDHISDADCKYEYVCCNKYFYALFVNKEFNLFIHLTNYFNFV